MNEHDFIEAGMIELYVLGLTDEEETRQIEAHLRRNPGMKRQVAQMRSELLEYARHQTKQLAGVPTPPASGVSRIVPQRKPLQPIMLLSIAIGLVASLLLLKNRVAERGSTQGTPAAIGSMYMDGGTVIHLDGKTSPATAHQSFFEHPSTLMLTIEGNRPGARCAGKIFYNESMQQCLLYLEDFPAPPGELHYQLWAGTDGRVTHAGIMDVVLNKFQELKFIPDVARFLVTLQPDEATLAPDTSQFYASGKF